MAHVSRIFYRDPECARVIQAAGGPTVIAIALGISVERVRHWLRIPAEYVPRLEQLTGIPGKEIRADMYLPLHAVPATAGERRRAAAQIIADGNGPRILRGSSRPATPNGSPPAVRAAEGP